MNRQEQLEFCKKCTNRQSDFKQGLLCRLTNEKADFEDNCEHYERDEHVKETIIESADETDQNILLTLNDDILNVLRAHQDFYYAIIGGLLASLISGVIWAAITVSTEYQIGYMAIGVGLIVGFAVRFFGAGIDQKFGFLGAGLALLGCLSGNLFSQVGFYAHEASLSYLEVLSYLDLSAIINILIESFSPMDVLFYGIALYEGYKLAFRRVSELDIKLIQENKSEGLPTNSKLRMPLVVVSIIAIGFFLITVNNGVSGFKTYQYESGKRMSEGELKNSKEEGKWTYWYENGNAQLIAHYTEGTPDSLWQWFDEEGTLIREGHYKLGLEHGVWMSYYENGARLDSGQYNDGRMSGLWKAWYANGQLQQIGDYKRSLQDGPWTLYHENGQVASEGLMKEGSSTGEWKNYFESGQMESIFMHKDNEPALIQNVWNEEGQQLVKDGEGTYKTYYITGQLMSEGKIKDAHQHGKWLSYYDNGQLQEEGNYDGELYKINNSWDKSGKAMVVDGNGYYKSFYADGNKIFESGSIVFGLREGTWNTLFESTQTVYQEQNYKAGLQSGIVNIYFESGDLYASGSMKDNKRDGEWSWFHGNGLISSTVNFVADKKEGKQTMWSEVGDITKEEFYSNGELTEEKVF
ncbi:toxin-antitoxin system YwqK family antitoxin [Carboxylicivirga marina]|uniref:toxin-antitoxin system YwqK family antitoxin n=1 Tax=Carboxylicivirga marina TaxID=2800988 RepID=UPI00259A0443|nr:toxin-antitoxin system YwqK family antitoxin [uncultured Carboxylicivirga sp.]